jgi:hypothetical protein
MPREELIAELQRLRRRELERVLAVFSPSEREQLLKIIEAPQAPEAAMPSFETLVGLSPWLLKAADRAQGAASGKSTSMTPAARAALAEALGKLTASQPPKTATARKEAPRLSDLLRRKDGQRAA